MNVNSRRRAAPDRRVERPAGKDATNSALLAIYVLFKEEEKSPEDHVVK